MLELLLLLKVEYSCKSVRFSIFFQFTIQGNIKRNKRIGAINGTWGPFFRVSFDLMIHSYVKGKGKQGWSSVLAFKANKGQIDKEHGDRAPTVAVNKNGHLRFSNSVSGNEKYKFIFNVDLNKWYNITIEQRPSNEKVTRKLLQV